MAIAWWKEGVGSMDYAGKPYRFLSGLRISHAEPYWGLVVCSVRLPSFPVPAALAVAWCRAKDTRWDNRGKLLDEQIALKRMRTVLGVYLGLDRGCDLKHTWLP